MYDIKKLVLKDIDLELENEGLYFLLGKNGAGKTTFIKAISSLINFDGSVLFDGKPIDKKRQDIFVMFDDIPLYLSLTGIKNIELICNNANKKVIDKLNLLSFDKLNEKVCTYSLGEKRKLYLIIAYLKKPKYLFIDELTNGLDYDTLKVMKAILIDLSKKTLIVISGHDLHFYQEIAQCVLILKNNNIFLIEDFKEKGGDLIYEYEKYFTNI